MAATTAAFMGTRALPFMAALCAAAVPVQLWAKSSGDIVDQLDASPAPDAAWPVDVAPTYSPSAHPATANFLPPTTPPSPPPDLAWTNPARLAERAGSERQHGNRWDWGDSALDISGFRAKFPSYGMRDSNLLPAEDRSALWGGNIAYDAILRPRDSLAFTLDGAIGKQRSAFTPQMAHRYSSQSAGAALVWRHDDRFALAAGLRINRVSTVSTPLARLAARAAGSPIEAAGVHLTAAFWPLGTDARTERRGALSLAFDAYSQRLSANDAAIFNGNAGRVGNGFSITLKSPF